AQTGRGGIVPFPQCGERAAQNRRPTLSATPGGVCAPVAQEPVAHETGLAAADTTTPARPDSRSDGSLLLQLLPGPRLRALLWPLVVGGQGALGLSEARLDCRAQGARRNATGTQARAFRGGNPASGCAAGAVGTGCTSFAGRGRQPAGGGS